MKKIMLGAGCLLICLTMLTVIEVNGESTQENSASTSQSQKSNLSPKKDYYQYINADWLKENPLPADKSRWGAFDVAQKSVNDNLMKDFNDMLAGEKETPAELEQFLNYYSSALDFEGREQVGTTELKDRLKKIQELSSIEELNNQAAELILDGWSYPVDMGVGKDLKDATKNIFYVDSPALFLEDKSYYEKDNETGEKLLKEYKKTLEKMVIQTGYKEKDAKALVKKALKFDASLVETTLTAEEEADAEKIYNKKSFAEFDKYSKHLTLGATVSKLVGEEPEKIIVSNPKYLAKLDKIFSKDTFENYKAWAIAQEIYTASDQLNKEMEELSNDYKLVKNGAKEAPSREKNAFNATTKIFPVSTGQYYGKTYLGEDGKADATKMVENTVAVYKERLQKNDWLGEKTRNQAIKKLDNLIINVAYPEKLPEIYEKMSATPKTEGGTYYGNSNTISRILNEDMFASLKRAAKRDEWDISGAEVNAYYGPTDNSINFPAAVLQAPFYDKNTSESANYGGVGMIMGHEISHAFDPEGSKFDENGSLKNWWTKADKKAFNKRAEAMVDLFDGRKSEGGKVDGELTLTENIADQGGLSCALEMVNNSADPDYKAFYESYAKIWRTNITKEQAARYLALDYHAPAKLRVNLQSGNMAKFYEVYDIKKGDPMYIAPKDRVKIW